MRNALLLVLAFACGSVFADIGEGNWEVETNTTLGGAPGVTAKQMQCLRAEDARDPSRLFGSPGPGCQFGKRSDDGSTFRFEISCSGPAPVAGAGQVRYARESMEGQFVIRVGAGEQSIETRTSMRARRVGPC